MTTLFEKVKEKIKGQGDQDSLVKETKETKTLEQTLIKYKDQIALALPKHLTPDRMIRLAITAYKKNPKLKDCDMITVFGCILEAAQLGLELDVLGQGYLVPFKSKKRNRLECQLIIGYEGLNELAYRSGFIKSLHADVVYKNDQFDYAYGRNSFLIHKPLLEGDRGPKKCWYACADLTNGGFVFVVLTKKDIDKARLSSASKGEYGVWKDDPEAMEKKTCYRRLSKKLPKSTELKRAFNLEELNALQQPQGLDVSKIDKGGFLPLNEPDYEEAKIESESESEAKTESESDK